MASTTKSSEHWSNTQLEMIFKCPEAYRRRYIEGERLPPGIAQLRGTGVHGAASLNFTQKIESHVDLPAKDIIDAAVAKFDQETAAGGIALADDEVGRGIDVLLDETRDDVADMAAVHAKEQAPDYQPILVEHSINLDLPGARSLLAIIDLADTEQRVVDFKTAKRTPNKGTADGSLQLTIYDAAFEAERGQRPSELRLDTIVQTKTKTSRNVQATHRTDADRAVLAARIEAAAAMVNAGLFAPAAIGAWNCSARWCGYWNSCRFVNSERRAASEE